MSRWIVVVLFTLIALRVSGAENKARPRAEIYAELLDRQQSAAASLKSAQDDLARLEALLARFDLSDEDLATVVSTLNDLTNESIYDTTRAAQPDEVWNARRGDGLEKAVTLATILHHRTPEAPFEIHAVGDTAILLFDGQKYTFPTHKGLDLRMAWPL